MGWVPTGSDGALPHGLGIVAPLYDEAAFTSSGLEDIARAR
jgi:hypothetical protein